MKKLKISKIVWSLLAAISMIIVSFVGIDSSAYATMPANTATASGTAATTNRNVTVIAFQQNWNSIAKECTDTYGPEGVGYVEISPPQETIKGAQWWTSYQPVSYKLDSKLGTEAELKSMIATCKAAGVGIIADAVINHMAGTGQAGTGVAGSTYSDGNFPAVPYTSSDFHTCTKNVSDYTKADEVWNCRVTGLQDLNTASSSVQDKIAAYMKKLLDLGVAGFRVDAAKHMDPKDLSAIKVKLAQKSGIAEDKIYWNQETLGNASEAAEIQPENYTSTGEVHEMNFAYDLKNAFNGNNGGLAGLQNFSSKLLPSENASVFVSNWDSERNNSTLTYRNGSKYQLANAFMLAYGYGTPYINSGYTFENSATGHDAGAPGATQTSIPDVSCTPKSGWLCVQRWTSIRGMVGFHNNVSGAVTNWWSNGSDAIAFERAKTGYLAINNSSSDISRTFTTSLPAGEYCNVYAAGDCSSTVTVGADGSFKATVPKHSALAIYTKALKSSWKGTQKSDPMDPDISQEDNKSSQKTDNTVTIYFKTDWKTPYIHHQTADGWTDVPGEAMTKACDGYYSASVKLVDGSLEFLFNDGNGTWDHPNGADSGNYTISKQEDVTVANGKISASAPCSVTDKASTKLIVHYRPKSGDTAADQRGVYVWGTSKTGKTLDGKNYAFNQASDSFGKVFSMNFDGAYKSLGVIVTTTDWNKDGQSDRTVDTSSGTGEIWVLGGDETTYTEPPAQAGIKLTKLDVTIHYHRPDGNYDNWDVWKWADGIADGLPATFSSHDSFGKIATYSLSSDSGVTGAKFIIRYGGDAWTGRESNGVDADGGRSIPWSAITITGKNTGKAEVWIVSADTTVYTNPSVIDLSSKITHAEISGLNEITVTLNRTASADNLQGKISLDSKKIKSYKVDGTKVIITTSDEIKANEAVKISITGYNDATAIAGSMVRTNAFDAKYSYSGNDLGATYSQKSTTFKVWAPTAQSVKLNTYRSTVSDSGLDKSYNMTLSGRGVWTVTVKGDCKDTAYDFTLTFPDGKVNQAADPYGRASTVNGGRSVVLSAKEMTPANWGKRMSAFSNPTDAVITEMSIRDFSASSTSGVSQSKRGKYLGVVEKGTKNSKGQATGLDYLKESGTTHVQIMPTYDFNNVNGEIGNNVAYNWGYDPMNYNVPEGSYSSNPATPSTRITEMKQMIQGLHKAGIRVIMDVVYNHVYDANKHVFNQIVPGYYFRYDSSGNLVSNSGCGNDTASERSMVRKYIVDSVTYWAKNYNLDGFRFDLMGLLDLQTMKAVRSALDKIDPSIMVVGEGWDMNTTMGKDKMSIQPNGYQLTTNKSTIGFFNDSYRDAIKGSVFNAEAKGFVQGQFGNESLLANNFLGCQNQKGFAACTNGNANVKYSGPSQVVQYVEVHDNLTLYDKLKASMPKESDATITKRDELANSMVLLSQGTPEIQLGQAFLRTKGGNDNSYNAGDSVNAIDWDRLSTYKASADYVKGLIALRKAVPALRQRSYASLNAHSKVLAQSDGVLAFELSDSSGTYVVAFNANTSQKKLSGLKKSTYTVVSSGNTVDTKAVAAIAKLVKTGKMDSREGQGSRFTEVNSDGTYILPALGTLVLRQGSLLKASSGKSDQDKDHGKSSKPALKLSVHVIVAGGRLTVFISGLKAHTEYTLWLHSSPIRLTNVTTDSKGSASVTVTIPASAPAGKHTIVVTDVVTDKNKTAPALASDSLKVKAPAKSAPSPSKNPSGKNTQSHGSADGKIAQHPAGDKNQNGVNRKGGKISAAPATTSPGTSRLSATGAGLGAVSSVFLLLLAAAAGAVIIRRKADSKK
ncbi:pullulanase [Scardovia inopinata]|uniref:Alpha-amylase n=1 Tax=Scardovia inopinata F0304 TaxID=641146 RepID=W5IIN1_SCAIO|nr:type I pullulanase [Scardovia inopinata]EFG26698.2 pullulanase, type I [Scardovia inopinata F0304]BAR06299.1 amylopullulanase [Scardovia inopinata JCM 12537]SUV51819.1 pullulanase [Scardovia inopinata]